MKLAEQNLSMHFRPGIGMEHAMCGNEANRSSETIQKVLKNIVPEKRRSSTAMREYQLIDDVLWVTCLDIVVLKVGYDAEGIHSPWRGKARPAH